MFDSDVFCDECVDAPLQDLLQALIENQVSCDLYAHKSTDLFSEGHRTALRCACGVGLHGIFWIHKSLPVGSFGLSSLWSSFALRSTLSSAQCF